MSMVTVELVNVTCICGIAYAIPKSLHEQMSIRKSQMSCHCPLGHEWHYSGENWETERKRLNAELASQRERAEEYQRQLADTKERERKLKARQRNGVCPCCKRTFLNVQRHMKCKHPEYK